MRQTRTRKAAGATKSKSRLAAIVGDFHEHYIQTARAAVYEPVEPDIDPTDELRDNRQLDQAMEDYLDKQLPRDY